jgi:predicted CopG family antitoxin
MVISHPHTDTHRKMGTKNIAISDDAYQRLKTLKRPGESFTEVIERMTRSREILELAGTLSPRQAAQVKERVREMRDDSSRRLHRAVEELS